MRLEEGKSYKVRVPNIGRFEPTKIHVDKLLEHPRYSGYANTQIIFRIWSRRFRDWKWFVQPYYSFAIFNDWEYKHLM
jgi:hypothetical protein